MNVTTVIKTQNKTLKHDEYFLRQGQYFSPDKINSPLNKLYHQ